MPVRHTALGVETAGSGIDHCPDCVSNEQIRSLVRLHGSPLLLIDCAVVRSNYENLCEALPDVSVHYAVKALPHGSVLRTLNNEGCNFDIASIGELELLHQQGVRADRVIHTHPIKTDDEIRECIAKGCTTFVFDNEDELRKFQPYRDRVKLILRIGFRNPEATVDLSKKFGVEPGEAISLLKLAHRLKLETIGLSFHVGSQCSTSRAHVDAILACNELLNSIERARLPPIRILDIGGGFPAPYSARTPDIHSFCAPIREALKQVPRHVRVISEPGRYLVASAGHSAASVVGRARREGAPWYYLDDGIYGCFGAQVFDGLQYPLSVITRNRGSKQISHLAGPTCDSGDMISSGIALPPLDMGDLIVAHLMGAYSCVTATDFNSVRKPKIVPLNGPRSDSGVIFVGLPVT